jgi:hypothetical protein
MNHYITLVLVFFAGYLLARILHRRAKNSLGGISAPLRIPPPLQIPSLAGLRAEIPSNTARIEKLQLRFVYAMANYNYFAACIQEGQRIIGLLTGKNDEGFIELLCRRIAEWGKEQQEAHIHLLQVANDLTHEAMVAGGAISTYANNGVPEFVYVMLDHRDHPEFRALLSLSDKQFDDASGTYQAQFKTVNRVTLAVFNVSCDLWARATVWNWFTRFKERRALVTNGFICTKNPLSNTPTSEWFAPLLTKKLTPEDVKPLVF